MGKKITILTIAFAILAITQPAYAQDKGKVWRIGTLLMGSPATRGHVLEWYRQGFKKLGYVEGRNYVFVSRWAKGQAKRLPALAKELVKEKVDVIVVNGGMVLRAAGKVTKTVPIVVGSAGSLGSFGFVASLARPSGNVTGSTAIGPELSGKRLELLRESVPSARRVAVLFIAHKAKFKELERTETAARTLGVKIRPLPVRTRTRREIESAFAVMAKERPDALVITSGIITNFNGQRISELVIAQKLPAICARQRIAQHGCLMAYVPDRALMSRRTAHFVDKILKGANPGDLPIERPTKFKLIVNLKVAKAIGITVPHSILLRADEVIE